MHIPPESRTQALAHFTPLSDSEKTPLMQQDHQQFANVVNAPESRGFCTWFHTFLNKLIGVFGEKLSPGQLNRCLDRIFSEDKGWTKNGSFTVGGVEQTLFRVKESAGTTYIICAPAHDLAESGSCAAHMAGGRSFLQTYNALTAAFPQGQIKVLIPVAQSNTYAFSGPRGHFTLLEVDMNNRTIQNAVLHDSKGGFVDLFYGGAERITEIFRNDGLTGNDFSVTVEHRGEQGLLNGNDCGRFAAYYAKQIIAEGGLGKANKKSAYAFFATHFKD
ncbi:hypothetical protein [unidentified bacterial endosymbiont]|uniref:hypothetical protein n=1 Tax=unidentified bacterial endosymbiont TaxID=2355 RepID=UPI0020A07D23|nr:hypothetical protein [unidentified bacterial endosymbiont]